MTLKIVQLFFSGSRRSMLSFLFTSSFENLKERIKFSISSSSSKMGRLQHVYVLLDSYSEI